MNKRFSILIVLVFGLFSTTLSANSGVSVPEPFHGFDDSSKMVIDYTDLNSLLDKVVLDVGRSDRKKASSSQPKTGTRMKMKVNRYTINEGNRFYFELFGDNEQNQKTLTQIKSRLEGIPNVVPLEKFSRNEQLAYWINLYNITMISEISKVYPEYDLEDFLVGKGSILSEKLLTVSGVPLSLNDIQFTILKENYQNNPLVIYGLYQGNIGSPNIRKNAYTGKYVWGDLIDNAVEFINSNRGTEGKSKKVFRVSSWYERNSVYFANFDPDLREHLLSYLEGNERAALQSTTKIKTDIDDWTVTDLYGNNRDVGGSLASNNAALMGAMVGGNSGSSSMLTANAAAATRYSPSVLKHLNELNQKRAQEEKQGVVTIEELGQAPNETSDPENKEGKDQ